MHMSKRILILVFSFVVTLTGYAQGTCQQKEYFSLWNSCESITALTEYVQDVTNPYSLHFIPQEDRIATFDMDGTILGELYPTYFEYNMLEYRGLDDPTYKAPKDVKQAAQSIRDFVRNGKPLPDGFELIHARAAAKAYSNMTLPEFDAYVKSYAATPANGFTGMTYGQSFYLPMLEIFRYLADGSSVWMPPSKPVSRETTPAWNTPWLRRRKSFGLTNSSSKM